MRCSKRIPRSRMLFFAVFLDKVLQFGCTALGRNAAQESEHNGFVNLQERIFGTDIGTHQQIELFAHQQADNGKVDVATENALLHGVLESEKPEKILSADKTPVYHRATGTPKAAMAMGTSSKINRMETRPKINRVRLLALHPRI